MQHSKYVRQVLRENYFYAKVAKCHLEKDKLHYVNHVVGRHGIKVDPKKIETITKWHRPLEIEQLQSWGFAITFIASSMDIIL